MTAKDRRDLEEFDRAWRQLKAEIYEAVMPHLDKLVVAFVVFVILLLIVAAWELIVV